MVAFAESFYHVLLLASLFLHIFVFCPPGTLPPFTCLSSDFCCIKCVILWYWGNVKCGVWWAGVSDVMCDSAQKVDIDQHKTERARRWKYSFRNNWSESVKHRKYMAKHINSQVPAPATKLKIWKTSWMQHPRYIMGGDDRFIIAIIWSDPDRRSQNFTVQTKRRNCAISSNSYYHYCCNCYSCCHGFKSP